MQEVKVLNLVNHTATPNEDITSEMINQWTREGWQLHTVCMMPYKIGKLELPSLCVVLVLEVVPR